MDRQNEIDLIATSILEAISQLQRKSVENASSSTGCIATDKNCDGVVTCDEVNGPGWVWSEQEKACVMETVTQPTDTPSTNIYSFVNTSDR